MGAKHPRASRAYWNLRLFGLPAPVHDMWMLVITALVVLALAEFGAQTDQTAALARQIQHERAAATLNTCQDQNARHDRTILRLQQLVADLPPGHERNRAIRSLGGTHALIDALAPHQDCQALVHRRVKAEPPH